MNFPFLLKHDPRSPLERVYCVQFRGLQINFYPSLPHNLNVTSSFTSVLSLNLNGRLLLPVTLRSASASTSRKSCCLAHFLPIYRILWRYQSPDFHLTPRCWIVCLKSMCTVHDMRVQLVWSAFCKTHFAVQAFPFQAYGLLRLITLLLPRISRSLLPYLCT